METLNKIYQIVVTTFFIMSIVLMIRHQVEFIIKNHGKTEEEKKEALSIDFWVKLWDVGVLTYGVTLFLSSFNFFK